MEDDDAELEEDISEGSLFFLAGGKAEERLYFLNAGPVGEPSIGLGRDLTRIDGEGKARSEEAESRRERSLAEAVEADASGQQVQPTRRLAGKVTGWMLERKSV